MYKLNRSLFEMGLEIMIKNLKKWAGCFIFSWSIFQLAFASQSCPAFLGNHKNTLKQVSLFNQEGSNTYELAPSSEKQIGRFAELHWNDLAHSDLPIYFICRYYETSETIQHRLADNVTQCVHRFPYEKGVVLRSGERSFRCHP